MHHVTVLTFPEFAIGRYSESFGFVLVAFVVFMRWQHSVISLLTLIIVMIMIIDTFGKLNYLNGIGLDGGLVA
jgi:hypothetical protein